jgi:hypothetical protein
VVVGVCQAERGLGSGRTGMETHVGSGEVDSNAAPEP